MKDSILIFIPMYNCEKQIGRVIDQLQSEKVKLLINEVLIVNNRSTDSGLEQVKKHIDQLDDINIKVVTNDENYGLGGSHKVAFHYAVENNFTHVVVLHGDDQGKISDLLPLLKSKLHHQFDALLGARFHRDSDLQNYSTFRIFGNKVFNAIFSLVTARNILDLGSGLNCYQTKILQDDFFLKYPDDLRFNYSMILGHVYLNHSIHFFPITWSEDDQLSNVKLFSQAYKILKTVTKYTFLRGDFIQSEQREPAQTKRQYSFKISK